MRSRGEEGRWGEEGIGLKIREGAANKLLGLFFNRSWQKLEAAPHGMSAPCQRKSFSRTPGLTVPPLLANLRPFTAVRERLSLRKGFGVEYARCQGPGTRPCGPVHPSDRALGRSLSLIRPGQLWLGRSSRLGYCYIYMEASLLMFPFSLSSQDSA